MTLEQVSAQEEALYSQIQEFYDGLALRMGYSDVVQPQILVAQREYGYKRLTLVEDRKDVQVPHRNAYTVSFIHEKVVPALKRDSNGWIFFSELAPQEPSPNFLDTEYPDYYLRALSNIFGVPYSSAIADINSRSTRDIISRITGLSKVKTDKCVLDIGAEGSMGLFLATSEGKGVSLQSFNDFTTYMQVHSLGESLVYMRYLSTLSASSEDEKRMVQEGLGFASVSQVLEELERHPEKRNALILVSKWLFPFFMGDTSQ